MALALLLVCSLGLHGAWSVTVGGVGGGALEDRIVARVNLERRNQGLQPLESDPVLTRAARDHSEEMIRLDYFAHESPTPGLRTLGDRMTRVGCTDTEVGENLAFYDGLSTEVAASRVVDDWLDSPGHRANLLRSSYTQVGIGVAWGGGRLTITQTLSSRPVVLEPVETRVSSGRAVVVLRGRVRATASEVAVFVGDDERGHATVGEDRRFVAEIVLRPAERPRALQVGLLAESGPRGPLYQIVSLVPFQGAGVNGH